MLPLAACVLALVAFERWMGSRGALPASYYSVGMLQRTIRSESVLLVLRKLVIAILYVGWFIIPLVFLWREPRVGESRWLRIASTLLALAFVVAATMPLLKGERWLMPRSGLIIAPAGIGPFTLYDEWTDGDVPRISHLHALPTAFWIAVTLLGMAGGYFLIARGVRAVPLLFSRGLSSVQNRMTLYSGL